MVRAIASAAKATAVPPIASATATEGLEGLGGFERFMARVYHALRRETRTLRRMGTLRTERTERTQGSHRGRDSHRPSNFAMRFVGVVVGGMALGGLWRLLTDGSLPFAAFGVTLLFCRA